VKFQQVGLRHPRVRQLRTVQRRGSAGDHRLFVAEGGWAHDRLLDAGTDIEVFLWCPEAAHAAGVHVCGVKIAARARRAYHIAPKVLAQLSERDRPDGLISLARLPPWDAATVPVRWPGLVLVADAIEMPGNLGALLRTLDACGGDCLVLTNRRTRLGHPTVFRGSRGMNLRVPVLEFDDPDAAVHWLAERRFTIYLATLGAAAIPYRTIDFGERTAIVVGNEHCGVSPSWRRHGFTEITIPMLGAADSLNVTVSASILLYEARARAAGW